MRFYVPPISNIKLYATKKLSRKFDNSSMGQARATI